MLTPADPESCREKGAWPQLSLKLRRTVNFPLASPAVAGEAAAFSWDPEHDFGVS